MDSVAALVSGFGPIASVIKIAILIGVVMTAVAYISLAERKIAGFIQERFGPTGGNGIAWQGGSLFFAPDDRVLRYDFAGSALLPGNGPFTVVLGLPANAIGEHDRKTVVLDHSGGLLVNIGSPSDACQEMNRIPLSPGIFPCPQLATRAAGQRQ